MAPRITLDLTDPDRPRPPKLYKYRGFGHDKAKAQLRKILAEHTLYFSSRTKFNDPFDCLMPSLADVPREAMRRFLRGRFRNEEFPIEMTRGQRRISARQMDVDRAQRDIQGCIDRAGILSLTEDPGDMLMWGHYADSHQGVCLEFSISENDPFFGRLQPVVYSSVRPGFNPDGSEEKNTDAAILTKSLQWMYEREWRIIEHLFPPANVPFPSEKLTAIVFGYQMKKEARAQILGMVEKSRLKIKMYEARPSEREYKMCLEPA